MSSNEDIYIFIYVCVQANETFWIIIIAFTIWFQRTWARIPITWTHHIQLTNTKGNIYVIREGPRQNHMKNRDRSSKEDSVYGWWSVELSSGREIRHWDIKSFQRSSSSSMASDGWSSSQISLRSCVLICILTLIFEASDFCFTPGVSSPFILNTSFYLCLAGPATW